MDTETTQAWKACIPIWTQKLPTMHLGVHRVWMYNIYRHGEQLTQDPMFWKTLQKEAISFSDSAFEMGMTQAGLFNNPMPFLHFEPYIEEKLNFLGEHQTVTGDVQYMRATFKHGTHPGLGAKLNKEHSEEFALFNLPIRAENTLFGTRKANTENYWRFFHGEADFPIDCLVDYYKSMLALNPSDTAYASWAHAAWDARRTNKALYEGSHWTQFENEVRPLYENHVDWELIAACHGFLLSPDNARNSEIVAYVQHHLMFKVEPAQRPNQSDTVAHGMLSISEPTSPWDVYTLFTKPPGSDVPFEVYPIDFS